MAVEALFNASYDDLLKRARIESANDEQTVALVNMSVSEVRIGFYKTLGATRVSEIIGYALVDNPSTEEQILRADAANIEALWLTYLLLPRLPTTFMAGGHTVNQEWNEEPLTRDAESSQEYLDKLKEQIDSGLSDLVEDPDDYQSQNVRASSIGAEEPYLLKDNYPAYGVFNR